MLKTILLLGLVSALMACEEGKNQNDRSDASQTESGEPEEFTHHLPPLNYTADEGKTLTGVCFQFTKAVVEGSTSEVTEALVEGSCAPEVSLTVPETTEEQADHSLMITCEPYHHEGTAFAQLVVYDTSYNYFTGQQFETTDKQAQELCEGLQLFAELNAGLRE